MIATVSDYSYICISIKNNKKENIMGIMDKQDRIIGQFGKVASRPRTMNSVEQAIAEGRKRKKIVTIEKPFISQKFARFN